jgi:hypothetical protein
MRVTEPIHLAEARARLDAEAAADIRLPEDSVNVSSKVAELPKRNFEAATVEDFYAYLPDHRYIFTPSRELWPATSVNARLPALHGARGEIKPSVWLDAHRAVEQMTWAPGEPMVIRDRLVSDGGWIDRPGAACFNLYRRPQAQHGDREAAGPWIDLVRMLYPGEADHIIRWLAHRVQRAGEKINHALVLGGAQGIGKDTILEPVKYAVGPWNFVEVTPTHLLGRFNGFVKCVVLRISEARDLGDVDRFAFYDHMKVYTATPPDVLRCDEKNIREHAVLNVCGVIITSNHKADGIYLPPDDRRHFVAWSDLTRDAFDAKYWRDTYAWYHEGGIGHVVAYLQSIDLGDFDPKAPPPRTSAFHAIVDSNRAPEDAELSDALDALANPEAVTLDQIIDKAAANAAFGFAEWLRDRKNRRAIPHRLETAGYVPVRNESAKSDGLWVIKGKRQAVYGRRDLPYRERYLAAYTLANGPG